MGSVPGPIDSWDSDLFGPPAPDGKIIAAADTAFAGFQAGVDPLRPRAEAARDMALQSSGWRDTHSRDVNGLFARWAPYQTLNSRIALSSAASSAAPDDVLRAQTPAHPGTLTDTNPLYSLYYYTWNWAANSANSLLGWVNYWIS